MFLFLCLYSRNGKFVFSSFTASIEPEIYLSLLVSNSSQSITLNVPKSALFGEVAELKMQEVIFHWHALSYYLNTYTKLFFSRNLEQKTCDQPQLFQFQNEQIKKNLGLLKCKNWGFLKLKTGGLQSFPLPTKWVGILYPSPSHFSVISLHLSSYFLLDCSCCELPGFAFCFEGAVSVGVSSGEVIQFTLMVQQTSLMCMCSSGNCYNIGFKNRRLKPWQKMPLTYSKPVRAFSDPLH